MLPIAPAGAIGSNLFGIIAPNCHRGSEWEQFVWTNYSQLFPRERFEAIRLDQLLPIAPAFVWTNCSQMLPRERFGAIRLDHLLPIAPA